MTTAVHANIENTMRRAHSYARTANAAEPLRLIVSHTIGDIQGIGGAYARDVDNARMQQRQVDSEVAAGALAALTCKVDFLEALASLSYSDVCKFSTVFGGTNHGPNSDELEVFSRYPALQAWEEERAARAATIDRMNAAAREQAAAAARAARPMALMEEMRSRGIELAVTREGRITAHPGDGLTADEVAEIASRKEEFVALLAPAHAVRPLVIA